MSFAVGVSVSSLLNTAGSNKGTILNRASEML